MAMRRAASLVRSTANVLRVQSVRHGSHGHKTNKELDAIYKTSMDHLPKPSGAWEPAYKAKDQKATIFFISTVLVFAGTIFEMERQGCFDLLTDPACWSDKQVERQARYYAKGDKWRAKSDEDDE